VSYYAEDAASENINLSGLSTIFQTLFQNMPEKMALFFFRKHR